jgi:DNA transformation protein
MPPKPDRRRFDDLFADFGRIALRPLFGGEGIYSGNKIIGIIVKDVIYLKTNEETRAAFEAEKCKPFYFSADGKRIASSYYAIPERLYDDPAELAEWANRSDAIARAARNKKRK